MNTVMNIVEILVLLSAPEEWNTKYRRIFIVCFPISIPLWAIYSIAYICALIAVVVPLTLVCWIWGMWDKKSAQQGLKL